MGAVLFAVFIILFITYRTHNQTSSSVDYQDALRAAKNESSWAILAPSVIPNGYKVTQARFEPESYGQAGTARWYLGFQTSNDEYLSLWQSDGPTDAIVNAASNGGVCAETVKIQNVEWTSCFQKKPLARVLYRVDDEQTIVISGTASAQELREFASLLRKQ